ncbi:hypothetical protein [Helicobacter sp. 23-1045]
MKFLLVNTNNAVRKIFNITAKKAAIQLDVIDAISQIPLKEDYNCIFVDDGVLGSGDISNFRNKMITTKFCIILSKDSALVSGFDSYIRKPFLPTDIYEVMKKEKSSDISLSNAATQDISQNPNSDIDLNEFSDSEDEFLSGVKDSAIPPLDISLDVPPMSDIEIENAESSEVAVDSADIVVDSAIKTSADSADSAPKANAVDSAPKANAVDSADILEEAEAQINNIKALADKGGNFYNSSNDTHGIDFSAVMALQDEILNEEKSKRKKGLIGGDIFAKKEPKKTQDSANAKDSAEKSAVKVEADSVPKAKKADSTNHNSPSRADGDLGGGSQKINADSAPKPAPKNAESIAETTADSAPQKEADSAKFAESNDDFAFDLKDEAKNDENNANSAEDFDLSFGAESSAESSNAESNDDFEIDLPSGMQETPQEKPQETPQETQQEAPQNSAKDEFSDFNFDELKDENLDGLDALGGISAIDNEAQTTITPPKNANEILSNLDISAFDENLTNEADSALDSAPKQGEMEINDDFNATFSQGINAEMQSISPNFQMDDFSQEQYNMLGLPIDESGEIKDINDLSESELEKLDDEALLLLQERALQDKSPKVLDREQIDAINGILDETQNANAPQGGDFPADFTSNFPADFSANDFSANSVSANNFSMNNNELQSLTQEALSEALGEGEVQEFGGDSAIFAQNAGDSAIFAQNFTPNPQNFADSAPQNFTPNPQNTQNPQNLNAQSIPQNRQITIGDNLDLAEIIKTFPIDKLRDLLSGVQITINITFPTKK